VGTEGVTIALNPSLTLAARGLAVASLASISTLPHSPNILPDSSAGISAVFRLCRSLILVLIDCY